MPQRGLVWWLFLLFPMAVKTQDYVVQHRILSVEDGLASRFVRKVIQDQQGFIWIATSEGLNRYDGIEVLYFSKEQHGLPSNDLNLLYEGPDGLLWVGSQAPKNYNGVMGGDVKLAFFNPETRQTLSFQNYWGDKAPFRQEELFGIFVDSSHNAWLGTRSGKAYLYDGEGFQLLLDNQGAFPISYALPAKDKGFWVLGPGALFRMDSQGRALERDTFSTHFLPYQITPLHNGGLEVQGMEKQTIKYPGQELNQWYRLPNGKALDVSPYWKIQEGPRGWLWCFTHEALTIFDTMGRLVADIPETQEGPGQHSFEYPFNSLFIDTDELAWITSTKALLLIDVRENNFRPYLAGQEFSLRSMIQLDKDKILVNTYKSIYQLDLSSGKASPLFPGKKLQGLGSIRTEDKSIWIALHGGNAARINLDNGTLSLLPIVNRNGVQFDALRPFVDKHGKLWMGTAGGLAHFDPSTGNFAFEDGLNQPQKLGGKACFWFCETPDGMWIATNEGLFLLSPDGRKVKQIGQVPPFHIFHIYPESPNRFWLSTRGGGLIRWDRNNGTFQQFTTRDGLSSNIIYAAYPDKRGYLWLPSQNGLMRFDTASLLVRTFHKVNGLPADEFNYYAHLRLEDGRLLFGTINGLACFNPEDVSGRYSEDAELRILRVQQFNSNSNSMEDITNGLKAGGRLELTSSKRFAVFQFFLDEYFMPDKNRYFYKIDGFDTDWRVMQEPQVTVSQLPWGNFTLRVRAIGQDGYWAGNELAIPVFSAKPLYFRWWFIPSLALAILILGISLFRWRVWRLRRSKRLLEAEVARRVLQIERDRRTIARQKAHLEEMNAAKDKLFSFVGHELRGPLLYFGNLANRISYALQQRNYEVLAGLGDKAKNIAASTNNMLDNLLNWSLLQGGRLSFGNGPSDVHSITGQVLETYREVAALKDLNIKRETAPGLCVRIAADALAILLQNLISNAIKFSSEGGTVAISAQKQGQQIAVKVEDQGKGMSLQKMEQLFSGSIQAPDKGTAGERGTGLGLQIVREILRRYDGEMKIESREGKGSTFTLLLPLAEDA
ncbi:MAG: GHKL domain-containing protein [Lewinellaceae bacterium]|nr:GHKL domain-containing protein [Lewinellaceae bacterium]